MKLADMRGVVVRETDEKYCGRPLMIELNRTGVYVWVKGTKKKVPIRVEGAWQSAQVAERPIPARTLGMSRRQVAQKE